MNVWREPAPNETPRGKTRRLLLHGIRCGVHTTRALSMHAGCQLTIGGMKNGVRYDASGPGVEQLREMEREGLIKKTEKGWVLA